MDNSNISKLTLKQQVTDIVINEGAQLEPINLLDYIDKPAAAKLQFTSELVDGGTLPSGIAVSRDGVLSGVAKIGTARGKPYEITVVAFMPEALPLVMHIKLTIQEAVHAEMAATTKPPAAELDVTEFKNYWQKFAAELQLPDIETLLRRKITPLDLYHLLGRFATLMIWNADDLTPANQGTLIKLPAASPLFRVYDFKSALVTTPTELYDSKRSLMDAIQTAKAMIQEIKRRKWNIELAGYDKMVTAAWVEVQNLNKSAEGHVIEVRNYEPSSYDEEVLILSTPQQQI